MRGHSCARGTDDNDLTYFIVHQADVIHRAIRALHEYIGKKTEEIKQSEHMLRAWGHLNHRQAALVAHALRHPGATYTVEGQRNSHMTAYDTARRDLLGLAATGLLEKGNRGKAMVFWPPAVLRERIELGGAPAGRPVTQSGPLSRGARKKPLSDC